MKSVSEIGYIATEIEHGLSFIISSANKSKKSHVSSSNELLLEASRTRFRSLRKSNTFTIVTENWRCWKWFVGRYKLFRYFRNEHFDWFIITIRPVFTQWKSVARRVVVCYFLLGENSRATEFQVISIHSLINVHSFSSYRSWSKLGQLLFRGSWRLQIAGYCKRQIGNIIHNLHLVGGLKICVRLIRGKDYVGFYIHRRSIRQYVA